MSNFGTNLKIWPHIEARSFHNAKRGYNVPHFFFILNDLSLHMVLYIWWLYYKAHIFVFAIDIVSDMHSIPRDLDTLGMIHVFVLV